MNMSPAAPATAAHITRSWRSLASPRIFYPFAGKLIPWIAALAVITAVAGLWIGFFVAPTDHQQGEVYRIIFLHVPAAWMSMFLYLLAALHAGIGLVFGLSLIHI